MATTDMVAVQPSYLGQLRKEKTNITLFTTNGVRMAGSLMAFDQFCTVLMSDKVPKLIYKHAISTVEPNAGFIWRQEKPESAACPPIQTSYLNQLRKDRTTVTVFITNGVRMKGRLIAFDQFSIALMSNGVHKLIYKHAISTIEPEEGFVWRMEKPEPAAIPAGKTATA